MRNLAVLSASTLTALAGCMPANGSAKHLVSGGVATQSVVIYDRSDYQVVELEGLTLSRPAQPMGYDEGLTAKRVAEAHCAQRGRRLSPTALGRYQAGSWVFDGACA